MRRPGDGDPTLRRWRRIRIGHLERTCLNGRATLVDALVSLSVSLLLVYVCFANIGFQGTVVVLVGANCTTRSPADCLAEYVGTQSSAVAPFCASPVKPGPLAGTLPGAAV